MSMTPSAGGAGLAGFPAPNGRSRKERDVSHYTIEELIARWKKEELTVEQVIGQILQLLREHERRLKEAARASTIAGKQRE